MALESLRCRAWLMAASLVGYYAPSSATHVVHIKTVVSAHGRRLIPCLSTLPTTGLESGISCRCPFPGAPFRM